MLLRRLHLARCHYVGLTVYFELGCCSVGGSMFCAPSAIVGDSSWSGSWELSGYCRRMTNEPSGAEKEILQPKSDFEIFRLIYR